MTAKNYPLRSATVALTILSTTTALWAQPIAPAAPATAAQSSAAKDLLAAFDPADANKDGVLSLTEAEAIPGLVANFDAVDSNRDGRVSKPELAKVTQPD
ncbi:hypothetical protein [Rhodoferax sp. BLA1]|uniref:hypothetical protein n=1 Tax=Rhodoferax sp. BLA1 TaxID=2576062 RepID=UPI0015D2CE32|nr:hypothetical protein [Rhodoferax sp. BLA1]